MTRRAVAAAVAVARAHGLGVDDPVVLADGINLVVHLRPAPVVARVATYLPLVRPDPARAQRRDLLLAAALTSAGAPVLRPTDLLPPGPHPHDGFSTAFWQWVEVLPEQPTADVAGRTLADLLAVLGTVDPGWSGGPLDTPFDDLAGFVEHGVGLGAPTDLVTRTAELTARLRPLVTGDVQPLHGDAHPGNLLRTPAGWVWADLEDTALGPRAWDVACLRHTRRLDGRAAVDAMPDPMTDEELRPFLLLRRLHTTAWWFPHAARVPADLPLAHTRLAEAVAEVGAALG
ncbi:phosphotransferase family protein [Modestobacter sp. SSW1-42]|uniref:phosphotransferase family protein n=1 Tax=Modestobacter sp. SSW1-42 TaxID=596372 RepID=UPI00398898DD